MKNFYRCLTSCIVCFFVLLLMLPNFGLLREKRNKELILEMETRTINPIPTARLLSAQFFKQFEKWYDDRLLGRKEMVRGWAQLNGKLFHTLISKEVEMGKDDFLFQPFNAKHELIDKEKKQVMLRKLANACAKHEAKFYVFLAPHSEWALQDYLPEKYGMFDLKNIDKEMREILPHNAGYITVLNKLSVASLEERSSMYYKGDYHWNAKGAFLGAKEILHFLGYNNKIDKPVEFIRLSDTTADIYTKKIGWKPIKNRVEKPWSSIYSTEFKYQCGLNGALKDSSAEEAEHYTQKGESVFINPTATHNVTVLILGDSFRVQLQEYLLQDIKKLVVVHNHDISRPRENIDVEYLLKTYKPDAVIYEKMAASFYNYRYEEIFGKYK